MKQKDDLISRSAALNALLISKDYRDAYDTLEQLPSVSPVLAQPRVIALEEIQMREVYWAERWNVSQPWPIAMHHIRNVGPLNEPVYQDYMGEDFNIKEYGKTWRCWTSEPTNEQREATPWMT